MALCFVDRTGSGALFWGRTGSGALFYGQDR